MSNTWSKIKPTVGKWYLSIAPDKRVSSPIILCPVEKCQIEQSEFDPTLLYVWVNKSWLELDNELFSGAMWQKIEPVPSDPFIENLCKVS